MPPPEASVEQGSSVEGGSHSGYEYLVQVLVPQVFVLVRHPIQVCPWYKYQLVGPRNDNNIIADNN